MSSGAPPQTSQAGQQQVPSAPVGGGQTQGGLPPTGINQQLAALNQQYDDVRNAQFSMGSFGGNIGFDVAQLQYGNQELQMQQREYGGTSLQALSKRLATSYGLAIGKGNLVDEQGNFLVQADEIVAASGGSETLGSATIKMNFIAKAIADEQRRQKHGAAVSALETGLGQVRSRGRGSLAAMQSQFYQGLAQAYMGQAADVEAADFSYWIQHEQQQIQQELQRRQEKMIKKQARGQFIGGVALLALGAGLGSGAVAAQGGAAAAQSAGQTGWF